MDPKQTLNKLQIKPSENFRQTHDKALRNLKPIRKPVYPRYLVVYYSKM